MEEEVGISTTISNAKPKGDVQKEQTPSKLIPKGKLQFGKVKILNHSKSNSTTERTHKYPNVSDIAQADKIMSALGITEEECANLKVVDCLPPLVLVHYDEPSDRCAEIRGTVIDADEGVVVCRSFPFTKEYAADDTILSLFDLDGCTQTIAYEGTIIRVYFAAGNWRISTHRKIDATTSRWGPVNRDGSVSANNFAAIFKELWGEVEFVEYLNPTLWYTFLISDPKNKIVCSIQEQKLYHVGTFSADQPGKNLLYDKECDVPMVTVTNSRCNSPNFVSWSKEEIKNNLVDEQMEFVKKATGVLVTMKNNHVIKIVPPCYLSLRNLRGNEPSVAKRMLALWRDDIRRYIDTGLTDGEDNWSCMKLLALYPEKAEELEATFHNLQTTIPVKLVDWFIRRYERGYYLHLEKSEHMILEATHKFYNSKYTVEDNIRYQMARARLDTVWEVVNRSKTE